MSLIERSVIIRGVKIGVVVLREDGEVLFFTHGSRAHSQIDDAADRIDLTPALDEALHVEAYERLERLERDASAQ